MGLRWAIRGCGNVSTDFVHALKLSDKAHMVVALCASSIDRCRAFANTCQLDTVDMFDDETLLFAQQGVYDVVYIGTLNHQHYASTMAALKAGKNVVCEKPLGANLREVQHMTAMAREMNVFFMEGYWTRFFPVVTRMRADIVSGKIGAVKNVMCNFGYKFHDLNKMDTRTAGGTLMATGCYTVMMALLAFDNRQPSQITAECSAKNDKGADLGASVVLTFDEGEQACLTFTSLAHMPNSLLVCGTEGVIEIPEFMWNPTTYRLSAETSHRRVELVTEVVMPLPDARGYSSVYPRYQGFVYEADAVHDAIAEGLKEHEHMTLEHSLLMAKVFDEIRRQMGVKFPQDEDRC